MIFQRRWFVLVGLAGLLVAGGALSTAVGVVGWGLLLVVALASVVEWFLMPGKGQITATRDCPARVVEGSPRPIRITVSNQGQRSCTLEIRDEPPAIVDSPREWCVDLDAGQRASVEYMLSFPARGTASFGEIVLTVYGSLGLLSRTFRQPAVHHVRVLPSAPATSLPVAAQAQLSRTAQVRRSMMRGATGREFESLRDYIQDDDPRTIDWKATARRDKLTVREYEVERSQTLIIALDLGRTMVASIDGRAKADHAVTAALALTRAAMACDDQVGLLLFDDQSMRWLPPGSSRRRLPAILDMLATAEAVRREADYEAAARLLSRECRTRALIVFFTDVWDAQTSRVLRESLRRMRVRHVPLCVTLTDTNVIRAAASWPGDVRQAYGAAVAVEMLEERRKAIHLLRASGVMVVDSPADRLSADVVARYLELKRRLVL